MESGRAVCAVVHQPQHQRTYTAQEGSGTWRDGIRLQRAAADPSGLAVLRGGVLRRFLDPEARQAIDANEGRFGDLRPRTACAGVEYPRMVEGEADFLLFWRTLAWDHAPVHCCSPRQAELPSARVAAPTALMTNGPGCWPPLTPRRRARSSKASGYTRGRPPS